MLTEVLLEVTTEEIKAVATEAHDSLSRSSRRRPSQGWTIHTSVDSPVPVHVSVARCPMYSCKEILLTVLLKVRKTVMHSFLYSYLLIGVASIFATSCWSCLLLKQ